MTLPNPEHLLDQAAALAAGLSAGVPRQTDQRRAISAAYYAIFHAILTECADFIVGRTLRDAPSYKLVYRSIEHAQLKSLCEDMGKSTPKNKYKPYLPPEGIGSDISAVARAILELQQKRHSADYDPHYQPESSELETTLADSHAALKHWQSADKHLRETFVLLLLFPPKDGRS